MSPETSANQNELTRRQLYPEGLPVSVDAIQEEVNALTANPTSIAAQKAAILLERLDSSSAPDPAVRKLLSGLAMQLRGAFSVEANLSPESEPKSESEINARRLIADLNDQMGRYPGNAYPGGLRESWFELSELLSKARFD